MSRGGCSLAELALIHFRTLILALSWTGQGCDGQLLRQRRDAAEGLILPGERNASLPKRNDKHVDEALLFEQCSITQRSSAVPHLHEQVSKVLECEAAGLNLVRWHVDLVEVEWHCVTSVLDDLDQLV